MCVVFIKRFIRGLRFTEGQNEVCGGSERFTEGQNEVHRGSMRFVEGDPQVC